MKQYSNFLNEHMVDMSDPLKTADELSTANAPILSVYGKGKHFKITDEANLFDVIKLIKSFADKHPFVSSMRYDIQMQENSVRFVLTISPNRIDYVYSLETVATRMKETIEGRYTDITTTYDIQQASKGNKIELIFIVQENNK